MLREQEMAVKQHSEWLTEKELAAKNKPDHNQRNVSAIQNVSSARDPSTMSPILLGIIIGALVAGIALTTILTLYIRDQSKLTTTKTTVTTTTRTTVTTTTSTTTSTTSTSTSTTSTSTTSTTSTSTTTTPINPYLLGNLRWNATGITVLNSTNRSQTSDLFFDSYDTLYIIDEYPNSVVWKLPKNAMTPTLIAGILLSRGSSSTQLDFPQGFYVDSKQTLYVTDFYGYRVQKYVNGSINGITAAGISASPGTGANQFGGPRYFVFDPTEIHMYITDSDNHRIMRHLTNSTTGANGTIVAGGNGNGTGATQLHGPWGIDYHPMVSDYLYITNRLGHTVTKWTPGASSGVFVAGTPGVTGLNATLLNTPMGIKLDGNMNMFVVDNGNHRVQMFCYNNQTGVTIAGNGTPGSIATLLDSPRGIAFDSSMNMYITDYNNMRIQKFLKF